MDTLHTFIDRGTRMYSVQRGTVGCVMRPEVWKALQDMSDDEVLEFMDSQGIAWKIERDGLQATASSKAGKLVFEP